MMTERRLVPILSAAVALLLPASISFGQEEAARESDSASAAALQEAAEQERDRRAAESVQAEAYKQRIRAMEQQLLQMQRLLEQVHRERDRRNAGEPENPVVSEAAADELVAKISHMQSARMELEARAHDIQKKLEAQIRLPEDTVAAMLRRIAESQIDHRLRLLESQAMRQVLEQRLDQAHAESERTSRAAVSAAEAALSLARAQFERVSQLVEQGFTSKAEQQAAEAGVIAAEAQLEEARSAESPLVSVLRERLNDVTIEAQVSEIMTGRLEQEAERVREELHQSSQSSGLREELHRIRAEIGEISAQVTQLQLKLKWYQAQKKRGEQRR